MTNNTLTIELICNGRSLLLGAGGEMDITSIKGLESSELQISTSDNALVDGASVDGKKIKARPIHIEASFKSCGENPEKRAKLVSFFNPKHTGKAVVSCMGVKRWINYELEGWTFRKQPNMDARIGILVDLICPDPYMRGVDDFGKNLAGVAKQFAFPWRVTTERTADKRGYPAEARGLLLGGQISGYRMFSQETDLINDGDVAAGLQAQFTAVRGSVKNPKILDTRTGQYIRVNLTLQRGDVLLVDTDEMRQSITLNGVNCYQKIDRLSDPFQLQPGTNTLQYDADEGYANLDVHLFYTPKYLGV